MNRSGHPGRRGLADRMPIPRVVIATVSRLYRGDDGRRYIDCTSGGKMVEKYQRVPLMASAGGGFYGSSGGQQRFVSGAISAPAASSLQPEQTTGAQVALLLVPPMMRPIFIGVVEHPRHGAVSSVVAPARGSVRSASYTASDHAVGNGGGVVLLDSRGAVVVDTTQATDGDVRVQLPAAGVMSVHRGGSDATRRVPDGDDTLAKLQQLAQAVNGLIASLAVAEAAGGGAPLSFPVTLPDTVTVPDATLKLASLRVSNDREEAGI